MYVWSIDFTGSTASRLKATGTTRRDSDVDNVAKSTDAVVSSARVYLTLKKDTGETWTVSGSTNSAGQITFQIKNPRRTYTCTCTYASPLNVETSDTYVKAASAGAGPTGTLEVSPNGDSDKDD